jgi:carbonic anhydrase
MDMRPAVMRKVFHFDAPREKYHCDAAIVWCFDSRFEPGFRKYLKRIGVLNTAPIRIAGGAKCLASPPHDADREFVLEPLRKSIRLHDTRRVILMVHTDCAACGGLAGGFGGDTHREVERLQAGLERAASFVRRELPGVPVDTFYVGFDGVWQTSPAAEVAP